jgi:hypothetical protein
MKVIEKKTLPPNFELVTIHVFNRFVENISDQAKHVELTHWNNEDRVKKLRSFYGFIKDSNSEHFYSMTFKAIDNCFSLICTFTVNELINHIKELVKCKVGGEKSKILVLYYALMFLEHKTFANYLRSICFKKNFVF